MYHAIEFLVDLTADLEITPKQRLEQTVVRKGSRLRVQIRPYVLEIEETLIEAADLFLEDGTTIRTVPFECFKFVE